MNTSRKGAPLLPKLRGYFAEFLNQNSLERLGVFHPPTCVGLRYGSHTLSYGAFLGSMDSTTRLAPRIVSQPIKGVLILSAYRLSLTSNSELAYPPASLLAYVRKYGNINPFPISYAFLPRLRGRLTLGRLP